jgi:hypothetical protein
MKGEEATQATAGTDSMDDVPILGREAGADPVKEFLAQGGVPAYARRAKAMEAAFVELIERCREKRHELLAMVRVRLGTLGALAREWDNLQPFVAEGGVDVLRKLHEELAPRLRVSVEPTSSARALRRALRELTESLANFNRRWLAFLEAVDLTWVNELRDGYNRYYVIEKECVVRSPLVARAGFQPRAPATLDEITAVLPALPIPELVS